MLHGSPKMFLDMLKNWHVCTSEIYCRIGNVFNTAYSKYSRSVLEVGLKLHRILRDGPGLIVGLFYGRFHYTVLDGTTGLSRGNYVNMSFPLRRPRSVHELATKWSRTTRSTLGLAPKSSRDTIGMTTRCRRRAFREFQEMDMSTGWSRGVSEVATDYSRNKNVLASKTEKTVTTDTVEKIAFPKWPRTGLVLVWEGYKLTPCQCRHLLPILPCKPCQLVIKKMYRADYRCT